MPTELLLGLVLGLVFGGTIGAGVAWVMANSRDKKSRDRISDLLGDLADAEARLEETRKQLAEWKAKSETQSGRVRELEGAWTRVTTQLKEKEKYLQEEKALLDQAKTQLSDTFKALAAQALATNNRGFLDLAEQQFKALKDASTADLDARKAAIETMVKPVSETLAAYQKVTTELEEKRQKEMGSLGEQLRSVASTQALLQTETSRLVNALKSPQVRGRWGEVALRKTAELAGMTAHCDFIEQQTTSSEEGQLRPDMVIKLPDNREVVVDSKVPFAAFIEAIESVSDEQRCLCMKKHAEQLGSHVDRLAAKAYWKQFSTSLDFVVMFVPNDSFLATALEQVPELVEVALGKKIVLASPTTFFTLLRAIEFTWRQHTAVENAHQIRNLGQELSDRFSVLVEHVSKVGTALGKAVESYNATVGSFESRLLPAARRFKELGAVGRKVIEPLTTLDARPRSFTFPDGDGVGGEQSG